MSLTNREFWTLVHGMILGAAFLLSFAGGLAGLYSLRPQWATVAGIQERLGRLRLGSYLMAVVAWLTVITGSYIVYPWSQRESQMARSLRNYSFRKRPLAIMSAPSSPSWLYRTALKRQLMPCGIILKAICQMGNGG